MSETKTVNFDQVKALATIIGNTIASSSLRLGDDLNHDKNTLFNIITGFKIRRKEFDTDYCLQEYNQEHPDFKWVLDVIDAMLDGIEKTSLEILEGEKI